MQLIARHTSSFETTDTAAPCLYDIARPDNFTHLAAEDLRRNPTVRSDAGQIGSFWLQAASCTGRSHMTKDGSSGQDSYCFKHKDNVVVVAVGDGLGSHPRSHIGSGMVCAAACDAVLTAVLSASSITSELLTRSVVVANNRTLEVLAGQDPRAFSTTLLVIAIDLRGATANLGAVKVGDGAIALVMPNGFELVLGSWGDDGGPANIVRTPLPTLDAFEHESVVIELPPDCSGVAAMTDGVSNDMPEQTIQGWLWTRWSCRLDAYAMADTLRYVLRGSIDDRTAATLLFHPRPASEPPATAIPAKPEDTPVATKVADRCWVRRLFARMFVWWAPPLDTKQNSRTER
jgi:hypothetical protein